MKYNHKNGITLTKIDESDLPMLKDLKDESWFGTHNVAIINLSDQKKWFQNTTSLVLKALISSAAGMATIGIFKIDNVQSINRSCDVGWDIFSGYRGSGLGKRLVQAGVDFCFEILNINRIDAEILENNVASQKCAVYAGFLMEGTRRSAVYKCNEYLDSHIYGITRNDWPTVSGSPLNLSYQPKDGSK